MSTKDQFAITTNAAVRKKKKDTHRMVIFFIYCGILQDNILCMLVVSEYYISVVIYKVCVWRDHLRRPFISQMDAIFFLLFLACVSGACHVIQLTTTFCSFYCNCKWVWRLYFFWIRSRTICIVEFIAALVHNFTMCLVSLEQLSLFLVTSDI